MSVYAAGSTITRSVTSGPKETNDKNSPFDFANKSRTGGAQATRVGGNNPHFNCTNAFTKCKDAFKATVLSLVFLTPVISLVHETIDHKIDGDAPLFAAVAQLHDLAMPPQKADTTPFDKTLWTSVDGDQATTITFIDTSP